MNEIEITIPFIVAILGVAYPVLLQVLSNLGEKYDSVLIVSVFKKEKAYFAFLLSLYFTLIIIFAYLIIGQTDFLYKDLIINHLGIIIIIVCTAVLIISFLCFICKILVYYDRNKLTKYFMRKDKKRRIKVNENFIYFEMLGDLLYWSIRNQNEHLSRTINDYFFSCFYEYCDSKEYAINGYPDKYYEVNYKAALELVRLNDNKLIFLEKNIPGGNWLLGNYSQNKIHEKTFIYLWQNLTLCTKYRKDDVIISYWNNASQYFAYSLKPIDKRNGNDSNDVSNQTDIDKREDERLIFLEFNYALGGLLLHQKRFNCVGRVLNFIQSEHSLLPQSMDDVFSWFFKFMDDTSERILWIATRYPFPETEGIGADSTIRHWIRKYIAVLFLRQYTLNTLIEYYPFQKHVDVPQVPKTQGEKKFWLAYIDYFKRLVLETRSDIVLMKELHFDVFGMIADEWCKENKKLPPSKLFDQIKKSLVDSIQETDINQLPTDQSIQRFNDSTNKILSNLFNKYKDLQNPNDIKDDYCSWHSKPVQSIIDKSAFVENQGYEYFNYHSFLAKKYAQELNYSITEQFYLNITKSYLLKNEDLFKGVDCLITANQEDYIIIAFDLYLPYYKQVDALDLDKKKYKQFQIIEINESFPLLKQSLVVIKKTDLPRFYNYKIDDKIVEKFNLEKINSEINLHTAAIDLNKGTELWDEIKKPREVDLRTQILLRIDIATEFRWKKKMQMVQLKSFSIYEEKGIPNELKDIEPLQSE